MIPHCRLKREVLQTNICHQIEAPVESNAQDNSDDETQPFDNETAGNKEYKVREITPVINATDGSSTSVELKSSELLNEITIHARGTNNKKSFGQSTSSSSI